MYRILSHYAEVLLKGYHDDIPKTIAGWFLSVQNSFLNRVRRSVLFLHKLCNIAKFDLSVRHNFLARTLLSFPRLDLTCRRSKFVNACLFFACYKHHVERLNCFFKRKIYTYRKMCNLSVHQNQMCYIECYIECYKCVTLSVH